MGCIAIEGFGGVDRLRMADLPPPDVGPEYVLIRVAATGVGPWDVKQREGRLGHLLLPYVLGWEVAGTVEAVADNVSSPRPSDDVLTSCFPGGGYAEFAASPESAVARKPSILDVTQAAAVPA
jgi:NADPH:quinone reductase-like Zn-dependent oxidoreductase